MEKSPTLVRTCAQPDRLLVVFSDIEMGAGGPADDFPHAAWLGELLLGYTDARYAPLAIDLVFNGDTFDLLKTSVDGTWPRHISAGVALAKLQRVAAAHEPFFDALRLFCERTGPRGAVHFVVGNHDPELVFTAAKDYLRQRCGGSDQIRFPGFELNRGRLHIEHGSQFDPLFRMDVEHPTLERDGEEILSLSWGAVALLDVAMPLQPLLYHHDRLKPRKLLFELLPELKRLLIDAFWNYWTGDYFRGFWKGSDPVKTVSWKMLKELVYRLFSHDPDVSTDIDLDKLLAGRDDFDLYLLGHQHAAGWWSYGNRKALRTGAMRDEFMLNRDGTAQTPLNKVYAEVFLAGDKVVRSHLVETVPPPRPAASMPRSIFDVLPELRRRLAAPQRLTLEPRTPKPLDAGGAAGSPRHGDAQPAGDTERQELP